MASADYLRKLTEDYQLSGHVAWGYDRLTSTTPRGSFATSRRGGGRRTFAEQARLTDRQLAAQVKLLANTERFYLMDRLSADLAWSDFDARTTGSYPNRQQTEAPTHRVENDLNYIRRTGRRTFTVTSNLLWLTQPQQLDVVREGSAQRQRLAMDLLRMSHNVAWGLEGRTPLGIPVQRGCCCAVQALRHGVERPRGRNLRTACCRHALRLREPLSASDGHLPYTAAAAHARPAGRLALLPLYGRQQQSAALVGQPLGTLDAVGLLDPLGFGHRGRTGRR